MSVARLTDLEADSCARILSHLRAEEVAAASAATTLFRSAAAQSPLSWETAIVDFDPFGELLASRHALLTVVPRLFPNGYIGFFSALARQAAWIQPGHTPSLRRRSRRLLQTPDRR